MMAVHENGKPVRGVASSLRPCAATARNPKWRRDSYMLQTRFWENPESKSIVSTFGSIWTFWNLIKNIENDLKVGQIGGSARI